MFRKIVKIKKYWWFITTAAPLFFLIALPMMVIQIVMVDSENASADNFPTNNEIEIWTYLKKDGYSEEAASGIMGNMYAESNFVPDAVEAETKEGYGLVQWSFERKDSLFEYAEKMKKDVSSIAVQMDFLCMEEMPTMSWRINEKEYFSNLNQFKNSDSIEKCTEAFMLCFERPKDQSDSAIEKRISFSIDIYNKFRGITGDILQEPDFNNKYAFGHGNPFPVGQCTWFVAGRFYSVYGYMPWGIGNGKDAARQTVLEHPNEFMLSDKPMPGAVCSWTKNTLYPEYGHVVFVIDVDEEAEQIVFQQGNVAGVPWNYPPNIHPDGSTSWGWNMEVQSFEYFQNHGAEYAVPRKDN